MDDVGRPPDPSPPPPREGVFEPVALTKDRPHVGRWAIAVALVLGVVIAKPWTWSAPAEPAPPEGVSVALASDVPLSSPAGAAIAPSARPPGTSPSAPADEIDAICIGADRWLVTSVERWDDRTIQVWRVFDPAASATGPDDPTIPVIPVMSEQVLEIGWCAPSSGRAAAADDAAPTPADAAPEVWRRSATGSRVQPMSRSRPAGAPSPLGAMYVAPRRPLSSRSMAWPDGTYVFRDRAADGGEHWFAIGVVNRPVPGPGR